MNEADGVTRPRPRALFLAGDLPWPPDGGGRLASYQILEAVCRRYDVDLIAMADPVGEPNLGPLGDICRSVEVVRLPFTFGRHRIRQILVLARSLLSRDPYRLRKFRSREFERLVRARLRDTAFDLVDCHQFGVMPLVDLVPAAVPVVAGHHDVESDLYRLAAKASGDPLRRTVARLEARKLRRAESRLLRRFDHVWVLAPEDKRLVEAMGVDRASFLPLPSELGSAPAAVPPGHRIISLGSMSWTGVASGLLWFHDEVLPLIRREVPDVEWELVGANAPSAIRKLDGEPGITVAGYVDDAAPHLRAARVGIVPLHIAGGIRIKLLNFLGLGLPSVATSVGARGLTFTDGEGCFRRDDPEGFARAVTQLLLDDGLWMRTVERGRAFVAREHSQSRFEAEIDAGIAAAVERHARVS